MDGIEFNIHSNKEKFEYHLSNDESMILEIKNVNGELKVSTKSDDTSHLNLADEMYDYLDLYEPDYKPERHKSSISDILKSRKERTSFVDKTENNNDEKPTDRDDFIDKYINKHSS